MNKTTHHGTVEELPNGRHRVRFRLDGALRTIETFATGEEAEAYRVTMAKLLSRDQTGKGSKRLSDYGEGVLTDRELSGEIVDSYNEHSRWKNHVTGDAIGRLAVCAPDDADVRDWLLRLKKKGLSRQTRTHCLNLLRAVLADAIEHKAHPGPNPCIGVKMKRERRTDERWTYLRPEEQDRLIAVTPAPLDAIVEFAIGSGLRSGELVALRLEDVNVTSDEPHVWVRYGGKPKDRTKKGEPTKGGKPRRVELFGRSLNAMRRWLLALPKYCPKNPKGLAFPGARGDYRANDHALRWGQWKGAPARGTPGTPSYRPAQTGIVEKAGITRRVRWHDLRHTCASSLVSGWWGRFWSLAEVCELMGHSSIKTTEIYAHLADTEQKRASRETHAVFHECSTNRKEGSVSSADSSMISGGAGHRARTGDIRLGNAKRLPIKSDSYPTNGTIRGTELLEAISRSESTARGLAVQLAAEVLSSKPVTLAGRVLAGGDHATAAAIELAELALASSRVDGLTLRSGAK